MKSNKKYFAIIGLLILVIIIAIVVLFTNSKKTIVENPTSEIETTNNDNVEDTSVDDEPTIPENIVEFTSQQQEQVETAFNSFMDNATYQTTIQKGDTLVYITFKDLGTVTFKMYDKTAPTDCAWFEEMVENNTLIKYKWSFEKEDKRLQSGTARWHFDTTDRIYTIEEQVDEIFPMKYCLYHKMASSNNFYICLGDYQVSEIDKANVDPEYIKFLEKYDGDMTLYQHCVILGRAVENEKLLDKLTNDFEITKITLKHT